MIPIVSICLPNLNTRRYLPARMESILGQTLTDWELIVCDSHSDDGAWEYFRQFKSDPRVMLAQVPREGIYAGWNECLRRAQGEYIYMATSDDTCRPELLEKLVSELERVKSTKCKVESEDGRDVQRDGMFRAGQPGQKSSLSVHLPSTFHLSPSTLYPSLPADIAACAFAYIDENGTVIDPPPMGRTGDFYGKWLGKPHRRSGLLELLVHLWLGVSWTTMTAVVFRRSLLGKTGLFRTDAGTGADMYWAVKTALRSDTLWCPESLATWRWHSGQQSVGAVGQYPVIAGVRANWQRVKLMMETVVECESMIPESWKRDPDWRDKLLWGAEQYYRLAFSLDRKTLRSRPLAFLAGCCLAAGREPAFLLRRLTSGLNWQTDEYVDWHERLHAMIREWQVPWPPVEISDQERR